MNRPNLESQAIESDVVVVGYGGAGATAAITAHDSGAKVIVLEKMPVGGGNTRLAGGGFLTASDVEGAIEYIETLCFGTVDRAVIQAFVENSIKNKDWIEEIGGQTQLRPTDPDVLYPAITIPSWPNVPGGDSILRYAVKCIEGRRQRSGEDVWRVLSAAVEHRGIAVMTGTAAKELIMNDNGAIAGVVAERDGERISIVARRAVVLTCGGFEYNEAMKRAFLPNHPFYAFGNSGNTGDGIKMAQKAGAALWHMPSVSAPLGFKPAEYDSAFLLRIFGARFIYVDKYGSRFVNETAMEIHDMWRAVSFFDSGRMCYPRIPAYAIFDDTTRRRGPLYAHAIGANRDYEWSLDNSKEIAKGWISQGKTIGELARRISVDEAVLEAAVTKYNGCCKSGRDADFGRSVESLEPIDAAPFYAIELSPCLLNTQGGPRRDREARVLDHEERPIPRLYAAGELGSIWGFLYQGTGNIGECLAFGRIAGRNAAAEEPWC